MRLVAALVAAVLGCSAIPADAGWYIGGEAGWTDLADQPAKATIPVIGPRNDRETWSGGYNLGIRGGYAWGPWRVEDEFRYQSNDARKFSGAAATGSAAAYAVMTNILYDLPLHWPVTPHIGAGIGAVELSESVKTAGFSSGVVTGDDLTFGYQAIGGVGYAFSPALRLDLDYRYLATTTPHFRTPPGFVDSGHPAGNLPVGSGYSTHSAVVSLIYRFGAAP